MIVNDQPDQNSPFSLPHLLPASSLLHLTSFDSTSSAANSPVERQIEGGGGGLRSSSDAGAATTTTDRRARGSGQRIWEHRQPRGATRRRGGLARQVFVGGQLLAAEGGAGAAQDPAQGGRRVPRGRARLVVCGVCPVSCATTGRALRGSGDGLATAHSGGNLQVS
jgi:hypothetical protein